MKGKLQVVILCGGLGTRLREESEFRPKPMVNIGSRPILWHIMKIFAYHDHNEFILALGYRAEMIKILFLPLRTDEQRRHDRVGETGKHLHPS